MVRSSTLAFVAAACFATTLAAQQPPAPPAANPPAVAPPASPASPPANPPAAVQGKPPAEFVSPEVRDDRTIVFRLHAPRAEAVRLTGGDLPGVPNGGAMQKLESGVWELTVGPVPPGAYRYLFNVDGVATVDPRHPTTSESNANVWSLAIVPGSEWFDLKDVPHGALAEVHYRSKSLDRARRAHVYTPPGYESGSDKLPVFYLLHGASDSDASWSTVGRANVILDNLIAAGKAKPMIVVMPAGHVGPFARRPDMNFQRQLDEFATDFENDLRPLIESRYRVSTERKHRAIAGLSMGGAQTLDVVFARPQDYGYVGVFSSGILGIVGGFGRTEPSNAWEEAHAAALDDAALKKELRLFWIGCGKEDFLVKTSDATVALFKRRGFDVVHRETEGGHNWRVWRDYLSEFAPLLFQDAP